jgi:hypothetical protein
MTAYSEDLRKKVVEAVERGMKKCEAAYTFGLSLGGRTAKVRLPRYLLAEA